MSERKHCSKGHLRLPHTIDKRGRCKICEADKRQRFNAKSRPTHCKWGHEFTAANTRVILRSCGRDRKFPWRLCRACALNRNRSCASRELIEATFAAVSRITPRTPTAIARLVVDDYGSVALRSIHRALAALLREGRIRRMATNVKGRIDSNNEESGYLRTRQQQSSKPVNSEVRP